MAPQSSPRDAPRRDASTRPYGGGGARPSGTDRSRQAAARILFSVACSAARLPAVRHVVHPDGAGGALRGVAVAGPGSTLTPEDLGRPMALDQVYTVAGDGTGRFALTVERLDPLDAPPDLPEDPVLRQVLGLSGEAARRLRASTAAIRIELVQPGPDAAADAVFAKALAELLSDRTEGCANDAIALRYFLGTSWRVENRLEPIDVREHVQVHLVREADGTTWIHTHGLQKFGHPEFEVFRVPASESGRVEIGMLDVAHYVIGGATMRADETLGDPEVPILLRAGTREREHWADAPVLEWVDVDAHRRPVESGAPRGLAAWLRR